MAIHHLRKQIDLKVLGHIEEWTSHCETKMTEQDTIVSYRLNEFDNITCEKCWDFLSKYICRECYQPCEHLEYLEGYCCSDSRSTPVNEYCSDCLHDYASDVGDSMKEYHLANH